MIKVSDYIVQRLADHGITQAFSVVGGAAMHLNDSFGRSDRISVLYNHHEQACAMAAEGYARTSGKPAAVVVTSGPGGTNAITGVLGQWLDSVPCIYLSGQVKRETLGAGKDGLRQLGDQEINIIDLVRPVTKYAVQMKDAADIGNILSLALFLMQDGRPGPVWLDIPLDIQAAMIKEPEPGGYFTAPVWLADDVAPIVELLKASSRPVLLAGHGIRLAGAQAIFMELVNKTGIPVVTSMNGFDLIPSDHPAFVGRVGTLGTRAGNAVLQDCDLLISIGSRNNIRQVSFDWQAFAPQAKKVVVDIDAAELAKPTLKPDIAINADAGEFLKEFLRQIDGMEIPGKWWEWSLEYKYCGDAWAVPDELVDPYIFMRVLTNLLPEDAIVVSGNGTASIALFQAGTVKEGQRMFWNSGCAAMGYDLPAAIGASLSTTPSPLAGEGRGEGAPRRRPVICITGDGSIQMNTQELQTIAHHQLPIKIFVLNNGGYHSIRQTQDAYFEGRHTGADYDSGVSCPDITKIAEAYGLTYWKIYDHDLLREKILVALKYPHPIIIDVRLTQDFKFDKQSFEPSSLRGGVVL